MWGRGLAHRGARVDGDTHRLLDLIVQVQEAVLALLSAAAVVGDDFAHVEHLVEWPVHFNVAADQRLAERVCPPGTDIVVSDAANNAGQLLARGRGCPRA